MRNLFIITMMCTLLSLVLCLQATGATTDVPEDWLDTWQFTGEVGASVENVRTLGPDNISNNQPGTTYYRNLSVRGEYPRSAGGTIGFTLNNKESMSARKAQDDKTRFTMTFDKGSSLWKLGDMVPKYAPWTLSGKRLFGASIDRGGDNLNWRILAGKYRKSPGARLGETTVGGAALNWVAGDRLTVSTEAMWTVAEKYDTGATVSDKARNRVLMGTLVYTLKSGQQVHVEYARSRQIDNTDATEPFSSGDALRISTVFTFKNIFLKTSWEDVDNDFVTLSGYSSTGRRVFINQVFAAINSNATFSTGYTRNEASGSSLVSTPFVLTMKPFGGSDTTLTVDHRRQKSDAGDIATFNRSSGVRMRNKLGRAVWTWGASQDSFSSGASLSKIMYVQMQRPVSDDKSVKVKLSREMRNVEELARHVYELGFTWDVGEWTGLSLTEQIKDRMGSGRRKHTFKARIKHFDPIKSFELGMDFQYISYNTHKDRVLSAETKYFF